MINTLPSMKILKTWKQFSRHQKTTLLLCSLSFLLILGSYPFIRSLAQSLFLEHVGVANRPLAWIITIVTLMGVISLFSFLQKKTVVQKLYLLLGGLSFTILGGSYYLMENGQTWAAYSFFVWKEVYIVMLVGMIFSFCNNLFTQDQAKLIYGPIGAIGAIGGIVGGLATSSLSSSHRLDLVIIIGAVLIILSSICFLFTGHEQEISQVEEKVEPKMSPLGAIKDVKVYVAFMCLLVASTQFAINSASQIFYQILQEAMPDKFERTAFLGKMFSSINMISLSINLLVMPWLLNLLSSRSLHYLIPILFLIAVSFLGAGVPLLVAGGVFVSFKAVDYSLFSVIKELLYFPLNKMQKYGAKYITDVFVYRSAKTVIALLLLKFSTQQDIFVILIASLILWFISVILIDRYQRKLKN